MKVSNSEDMRPLKSQIGTKKYFPVFVRDTFFGNKRG